MNPQATNHPVSWFKNYYDRDALDLQPRFQRKPVWSDAQASYLVDSILSELPIPEVFLRTKTAAEGTVKVEVVDGQQRLRSIIRFFTDDLVLEGENVSAQWNGTSWSKLAPELREKFWAFKLVVRELEGVGDIEVRDMFRRLNANQASLNDQELRHAEYDGAFIHRVERLADDEWWLKNGIVTPGQIRRMLDAEYVSELLVALMSGPLDKKNGLDDAYETYATAFEDEAKWTKQFAMTRSLTADVVGGDFKGWDSKTEYYSLFLACGRLVADGEVFGKVRLAGAQERLRQFRAKANVAKQKNSKARLPRYVVDYAESATRASTDLGRRLYRIMVVEHLLRGSVPRQAT